MGLKAAFEKPAFLEREQRLLASASALREDTSAYLKTAANASVGLDRRLARQWWGGLSLFGEGGSLKDNENEAKAYGVFSPRANLRRDSRNNVLNPSSGSEIEIKLQPFTGFYEEGFNVLAGTIEASFYYAPFRKKGLPDDKLILAARVEGGAMSGAPLRTIPSSMRYYAGGAGLGARLCVSGSGAPRQRGRSPGRPILPDRQPGGAFQSVGAYRDRAVSGRRHGLQGRVPANHRRHGLGARAWACVITRPSALCAWMWPCLCARLRAIRRCRSISA